MKGLVITGNTEEVEKSRGFTARFAPGVRSLECEMWWVAVTRVEKQAGWRLCRSLKVLHV